MSQTTERIAQGYAFSGTALELGTVVHEGMVDPAAKVRIPLGMLNRHGLVAGATGTGKTKTLQLMAEQLAAAGVAVFAPDIKGDLSGLVVPGAPNDKITQRVTDTGDSAWAPTGYPTEFFALGGIGTGIPIRATVTSFGPILMSKVLGLNDTQESALSLIFHWSDQQGLALLDLADLRAVISYLTSDEGVGQLKDLGGVAKATAGVILRKISELAAQGAEDFFGEPELDTADLLRLSGATPDAPGRGIINLLELADLQSLTQLGTGEAIVTVMSESGAPTPVAWCRMPAPRSLMAPAPAETVQATITGSALHAKYAVEVDRESAYERLSAKVHGTATDSPTAPDARPESPRGRPEPRRTKAPENEPSMVEQIVASGAFKSFCARPAPRSAVSCSARRGGGDEHAERVESVVASPMS